MRQVLINGTDYNKHVESVVFSSGLGEGSGVTIMCNPGMPEIKAFSPIIVKMNSETVFKGYVGSPKFTVGGPQAKIIFSQYECYDDGAGFKNILITGEFAGSPKIIMDTIVLANKAEYPKLSSYTFHFQSSIDVVLSVAYSYTEFESVCDQIASQMSGYWFVSTSNQVYFFQDSISDVTGNTKTIQYKNVQTPYKHDKITDEIVNQVTVLGGEVALRKTAIWTYDGNIKEWSFPSTEPPMSVTATINGVPAFLVAEGFSGDPSNAVSDLDAKETVDHKTDSPVTNKSGITHVVVHHIAAKTATKADLKRWHTDPEPEGRGWGDIGYHWYVRKSGEVIACRPESVVGAHAKGHNYYSIGVAVEGNYDTIDTSMPKAQYNALLRKVAEIMDKYKMPRGNVLYHGEVGNTDCPGKNFPKTQLRTDLKTFGREESGSGGTRGVFAMPMNVIEDGDIGNPDTKVRLVYALGDSKIKIDSSHPPTRGSKIEITWTTSYNVSTTETDTASVREYGLIPTIEVSEAVQSKEEAIALARAILKHRAKIRETLSLDLVHYQQLFAGEKVYLPWLSKTALILNTKGELNYNKVEYNRMNVQVRLL